MILMNPSTYKRTMIVRCTGKRDDGHIFRNGNTDGFLEVTTGSGDVLPDLEKAMISMRTGEKRKVRIPCYRAYGPRDEGNIVVVDRTALPSEWDIVPGVFLPLRTPAGSVRVRVMQADDRTVTVDCNHELAGYDLTFDVEMIDDGLSVPIAHDHEAGCSCGCHKLRESLMQ